jgi:hypothetical protein
MTIKAPWSAEQVDALNRFQRTPHIHPFTCPGHDGGGDRDLVATRQGWICRHCDYRQDWAHDLMLDAPPPPPFLEDAPRIVEWLRGCTNGRPTASGAPSKDGIVFQEAAILIETLLIAAGVRQRVGHGG